MALFWRNARLLSFTLELPLASASSLDGLMDCFSVAHCFKRTSPTKDPLALSLVQETFLTTWWKQDRLTRPPLTLEVCMEVSYLRLVKIEDHLPGILADRAGFVEV